MRVTLLAGAFAGALALSGCVAFPPDNSAPPAYPAYSRQAFDEPLPPPPPPPPPPADSYPDRVASAAPPAEPPYSNPPADYSSAPLPPPSIGEEAPDNDASPRPDSDISVSAIMNEEDAALRSALGQWGVIPARNGDNLIVGLDSDRLFEGDSANLTAQGRDMVISLSRVAKRYPSTYVNVDGFTDTNGERQANMMISQERADAVADVLSDQGVESRRLSAVGHGEDFPKVPTGAGVAEPKNRRVEITLEPYAG